MSTSVRRRASGRSLGAVLVLAVPIFAGVAFTVVGLARVEVRTDLASFLPHDDPAAVSYDEVAETFGGDPIVVLLESKGDTDVLAPEVLTSVVQLEGQLSQIDDVAAVYGPGTLLNQLAGRTQDLLAQLFGRRDAEAEQARQTAVAAGASPEEVAAAGAAVEASFDTRYGPLLVSGLPGGLPTLANETFIRTVVLNPDGTARGQWQFVVPSRDALAITIRPGGQLDAAATDRLVASIDDAVDAAAVDGTTSTVTGSAAVVAGMSDRALRDMPVLGTLAVVMIGACFMAATWIRRSRRLAPLAATLAGIAGTVAVLGWLSIPVSLAIVAFLPVLLGIGCYYPTYLLMGASPRTFVTVVLSSAAAFGTLALTPLPLVRDLGLTMALGVVLAGSCAWFIRSRIGEVMVDERRSTPIPVPAGGTPWRFAAGALVLVALFGWVKLADLPLRSEVDSFAAGLTELEEARHVERTMGSAGEVSLVLRGSDVLTPEAYAWSRSALTSIVTEHGDSLRPIVSVASMLSFLGDAPTADQIDSAYRLMPQYLLSSVVSVDRSESVISLGVRLDDLADLSGVLDEVEANLPELPPGYEAEITGLPVVLGQGEALVSADRYPASIYGIVAAASILAIGLRRRADAARGALTAAIATGVGFAVLEVTGGGLDPVTATLGALTAAIGCEFTVVLAEAVRGNRRLAAAVPLVAVSSVLGYGVLLASGLPAVRSFGVFLGGSVLVAVVAAWVVVAATVTPPGPDDHDTDPDLGAKDRTADDSVADRQEVLV